MKNLFVTIAMIGIVSFATAQETPKSNKKTKTQSDTITHNRTTKTGTEKKSTTHKSETHKNPTSTKKSTSTTTRKDSVSTGPTTPN